MNKLETALLAGAAVVALATNARAATVTQYPNDISMILIDGDIEQGDTARLQQALSQVPHDKRPVVLLQSRGGDAREGIKLGLTLRASHATTGVPTYCFSACALAWLGGENRLIATAGQVGFHGVYNSKKQTSSIGNAEVGFYIAQLGLSYDVADYVTEATPDNLDVLTPVVANNLLHLNVRFVDLSDPPPASTPVAAPVSVMPQPASPDAQSTALESAPYAAGRTDRQNWEAWFNAQSGSYHSGAEYWAGARNTPGSLSCERVGGDQEFVAGCQEARRRLTSVDQQRRTSADYKAGWNSV